MTEIYRYGRCTETSDPDTYFRASSTGKDSELVQRGDARALCTDCSVRNECLEVALLSESDAGFCWGVWGGTSARDRRRALKRARRQGVEPADILDELMAWLFWITDRSVHAQQQRHTTVIRRPVLSSSDRVVAVPDRSRAA
ncbi:WhiB family transcriptional regulator [Saccharopolyspora sp. NPDC002376]